MFRISIDIGGTFTDVVAETADGHSTIKVLTQPQSPESGALDGLDRLLSQLSATYADISSVVHGTTLATNALIERRGARTALITSRGFRDVLEMRYEKRFDQYALDIELPKPLVPRPLRLTLDERILATGEVLRAPTIDEIKELANTLKEKQVEAVAIGFLHSYRNPAHERLVHDQLRQQLDDDVTICQSAEVAGEIREFERFSTACANAYVRPLVTRYMGRLLSSLQNRGFTGSFLLMLSDGALTTLEQATRFPIRLVEGGPAGGVALATHIAQEISSENTLSLDIGGTTAKICFVQNGKARITRRFEIARAWQGMKGSGLPVKVPTVELVEIGAGGGSIAQVDTLNRLRVGPKSAGSEPGPCAYNQGGTDATITDAHLVVGNLSANGFADGIISLEPRQANRAIAQQIQHPLGFEKAEAAAAGIIEMANETMANAARVHGIELGLDIRKFDLLVSGGGGGLHAVRIAEKLGIDKIIVPRNAGVGSAIGFLTAPVAFESALSIVEILQQIDTDTLTRRLIESLSEINNIVCSVVDASEVGTQLKAELRYQGQGFEFEYISDKQLIDSNGELDCVAFSLWLDSLSAEFRASYRQQFGFTLNDIPIELVSIAISVMQVKQELPRIDTSAPEIFSQPSIHESNRPVYELTNDTILNYQCISRQRMTDTIISGPVVIPEAQTTTLVRPGWTVKAGQTGHLILERTVIAPLSANGQPGEQTA